MQKPHPSLLVLLGVYGGWYPLCTVVLPPISGLDLLYFHHIILTEVLVSEKDAMGTDIHGELHPNLVGRSNGNLGRFS